MAFVADKFLGLIAQVVGLVLLVLGGVGLERTVLVDRVVLPYLAGEGIPPVPTRRNVGVAALVAVQELASIEGGVAGFVQPGGYRGVLKPQLDERRVAALVLDKI